jgi:hypothetical protein
MPVSNQFHCDVGEPYLVRVSSLILCAIALLKKKRGGEENGEAVEFNRKGNTRG